MSRQRTIATPGATTVVPAGEVASSAVQADPAQGSDLAAFESDELPIPDARTLQLMLAQSQADKARMLARIEALEGKKPGAVPGGPEVYTEAEAAELAAKDIAAGKRPRSRLTSQGWYVHPEAARVAVSGAKA